MRCKERFSSTLREGGLTAVFLVTEYEYRPYGPWWATVLQISRLYQNYQCLGETVTV